MLMLPEVVVVVTAFVLIFADLFCKEENKRRLGFLAIAGIALAIVLTLRMLGSDVLSRGEMFGGRFMIDSVALWFKLLFLLAAGFTLLLSFEDMQDRGEFYSILMFVLSGMMFLVSAQDMITLYVSLELATIPLFLLAAWDRSRA